jgi:hypothetical protein
MSSQDLSTCALGNYVDEFHSTYQPFMTSFVVFNMLTDGIGRGVIVLGGWRFDNESFWHFTTPLVRYRNNSAVVDKWMIKDMCFKFRRSYL